MRIIGIPEGEAPEWVRERWIGLELPLYPGPAEEGGCVGVVTGDRVPCSNHYTVKVTDALEVLSQKSTEAVKWWMEESIFKQEAVEERRFFFNQDACEIII